MYVPLRVLFHDSIADDDHWNWQPILSLSGKSSLLLHHLTIILIVKLKDISFVYLFSIKIQWSVWNSFKYFVLFLVFRTLFQFRIDWLSLENEVEIRRMPNILIQQYINMSNHTYTILRLIHSLAKQYRDVYPYTWNNVSLNG